MAVSGLLLAHRLRGLEVREFVESQIPENVVVVDSGDLLGVELRILTTHVDEIPRQIQIALLTGRIIQLRQRQFDFRMSIDAPWILPSSGPKLASMQSAIRHATSSACWLPVTS